MRIWMRNIECGVGDFTHARQSLDVEGIIGHERTQYEAFGGERWLIVHNPRFYASLHRSIS